MHADEKDRLTLPRVESQDAPPRAPEPEWSNPDRVPGSIILHVSGPPTLNPAEFLRLEALAPMI